MLIDAAFALVEGLIVFVSFFFLWLFRCRALAGIQTHRAQDRHF
jgi:hypothetical protein